MERNDKDKKDKKLQDEHIEYEADTDEFDEIEFPDPIPESARLEKRTRMMAVSKAKRRRVAKRDKMICGIHLGGCGKPISERKDLTVDHIVPKDFVLRTARNRSTDYNQDCNLQPMHATCNNKNKGSQMDGWPGFKCKCHYLQVIGEDLFICTKSPFKEEEHIFVENIVSPYEPRADVRVTIGSWKSKGGTNKVGWKKDQAGHWIPTITRHRVRMFNLTERGRVRIPVPQFIYLDDKGQVINEWGSNQRK